MFKLNKTLAASAVTAMGMAISGGAAAQAPSAITPTGPIAINGFVSVNNTAKGGSFTDFRCKIEGWGFITDTTPATVRIDFLRPLNESAGQIPRGCHGVNITFPMTVTLGAMPVPVGTGALLVTNNVTVSNVIFQAPPQPGCGTSSPGVITTGGGGTVSWEESNPAFPFAGAQYDNTHTRLVFTNAIIAETGPDCIINGAIKFSRWTSLHAQP